MSTGVLQALMQLFAIIAKSGNDDGMENSGRDVIAIFLRQQLNRDLVKKFLTAYDEFISNQQVKSRSKKGGRKRTSLYHRGKKDRWELY